jgi:hypothetical protein
LRLLRSSRVALALLTIGAALVLIGAGGGSAEEAIAEAIRMSAISHDPGVCSKFNTKRFNEQNSYEKGRGALRSCERRQQETQDQTTAVKVSEIAVRGRSATATVAVRGGTLNRQTVSIALVERGNWKLDRFTGFVKYDAKALAHEFKREFEGSSIPARSRRCLVAKFRKLPKAEAEEILFGGSATPIVELSEECA